MKKTLSTLTIICAGFIFAVAAPSPSFAAASKSVSQAANIQNLQRRVAELQNKLSAAQYTSEQLQGMLAECLASQEQTPIIDDPGSGNLSQPGLNLNIGISK